MSSGTKQIFLPENTQMPEGTGKNVQHHLSLGKCKSKLVEKQR